MLHTMWSQTLIDQNQDLLQVQPVLTVFADSEQNSVSHIYILVEP